MRRLPTVALGVALCTLATGADARPSDIPSGPRDGRLHYADGGQKYSRARAHKRSARSRRRHHHAARAGRRHAIPRSARRPVARRGVIAFARGGTSRACLTPAARSLLGRIEAQFGRVQVISTCRPGARIAGSGRPSRHASGNAIDFNAPPGRKGEVVRWLIANHRAGGIMTYAGMGHVHVDVGRRFVSLNAGGRRWRGNARARLRQAG